MVVKARELIRKYSPNPDFVMLPCAATTMPSTNPMPTANDTPAANDTPIEDDPSTIAPRGFCPILLCQVSDPNESDRWSMLLQLAVCARLNALVAASPIVVQAVYLSENHKAERYLAYADIQVGGDFVYCQASRHLLYGRITTSDYRWSTSAVMSSMSETSEAPQSFFGRCTTLIN